MADFSWNRRCLSLVLLSVVFVACLGFSQATVMDWFNRCCIKGKQKAANFKGRFDVCNKDDLDRRNFPNIMDRMVCRMSERVCCFKELEKTSCERGKYHAFQAKPCTQGGNTDRYMECCSCCALGIKARSAGVGCIQDAIKGNPCEAVYKECCSGQAVTALPYSTEAHVLTPAPTTKQPTAGGCVAGFCQHICREDRSKNPICYCRNGYFIASDKRNCLDVNECTMSTPVCSGDQQCINTEGSYRCVRRSVPTPTGSLAGCSSDGYELIRGSCQDVNECERRTATCSREQTCVNTIGSYRCTCGQGYAVSGQRCVDKDECATREARCPPGSVCKNLPGTYVCSKPDQCPTGKRKTASGCVDIDECANGGSVCGSDRRCVNTDGSYRCVPCGKGFQAQNNRCVDKNECTNGEANCPRGTVCKNSLGSFTCSRTTCPTGKRLTASGCVDIDECATNRANCIGNTRCVNTDGSYRCAPCPTGTRADNNACIDINECTENRHRCQSNQRCVNTPGSYRCIKASISCLGGFKNVNGRCVDIDECVEKTVVCPDGKQCKNERGTFSCVSPCSSGYKLVSGRCQDINECVEYRSPCQAGQVCANIPGSYRCERPPKCSPGFEFKNGRCLDIDECFTSNPCFAGQRCENYAGSYRCVAVVTPSCPRGYKRENGRCVLKAGGNPDLCTSKRCPIGYECKVESNAAVCKDIDECVNNPCKRDEKCVNKPGRYFCLCKTGYERNQYTQRCEDINECRRRFCEHNCINSPPGSFTCSCHRGFKLAPDKRTCIDINECEDRSLCQRGRCTNTRGSYYCSCNVGFYLTASGTCEDVDECSEPVYGNPCEFNCTNIVGSYRCSCPQGFDQADDKHSCSDINECKRDPGICSVGTVCRNTNGNYRCIPFSCPQPYYLLEGDSKCLRKCPDGDPVCARLKDKVYQFWFFEKPLETKPHAIFTYRIIAQGYRNPDIRYRFRSGNEEGHFEIRRFHGNQAQIWTRITFTRSRDYVLEFVGELYDGGDLISRYVHTLYVFVSNRKIYYPLIG